MNKSFDGLALTQNTIVSLEIRLLPFLMVTIVFLSLGRIIVIFYYKNRVIISINTIPSLLLFSLLQNVEMPKFSSMFSG
jgi:hypothetical protein